MLSIKTFGVPFVKIIGTPLYQWESGRKLQINPVVNMRIDAVDFSNVGDTEALVVKPKEENGMIVAEIPNILLQSGRDIEVYSVNVSEDKVETIRHCSISVRNRPKPADYVYTETEVLTWKALDERLRKVEGKEVDPEAIADAVNDYMAKNPVTVKETDPTVPAWAKQPTKPSYTAAEVGAQIADCVVTFSEVNGEWTADKTFEEVREAFEAGRTITAKHGNYLYDLYSVGGGEGFGFIDRDRTGLNYEMLWLWEGDGVTEQNGSVYISHPVQSVNGKTGAVVLTAEDVGALPDTTKIPTVPTKVSAFANDKGYQTEAEVNALINTALGSFNGGGSGGSGGSSGATGTGLWTLIREETLAEAVREYSVTEDSNGNPFAYDELMITVFQKRELATCGKLYYHFNNVQCGSPFGGSTGINRAFMFKASRDGMIHASWAGNENVKESAGGLDNIPQGSSLGMYFPAVASSSKLASAKLSTDWWSGGNLQAGLIIRLWGRNK